MTIYGNGCRTCAKAMRHRLAGHSRHLVTERHEHVVDYGSHAFYGRIVSTGKGSEVN